MRWYIVASFSRQEEMREVRARLLSVGEEVQARWIVSDEHNLESYAKDKQDEMGAQLAIEDLEDITKSDGVINFTETAAKGKRARGGRHVEFGIGLALNKRMVLIGARENVFHYLPSIEIYSDLDAFMEEGLT